MMNRDDPLRLTAFSAMALVWGLTWIAAKWAMLEAPPVMVAGLRLLFAFAFFLAWAAAARLPLRMPQLPRLVASSLLINTGCYSLLFWGVARTPTGLAAIVNLSLVPVLSMGIGFLYGEERITARRIAAVCLGAAGLGLLFSSRGLSSSDAGQTALGLVAIVGGTVSYAWGAIVSKPLVRAVPPVSLAVWQTAIGGIGLLLISAATERPGLAAVAALLHGRSLAGIAFLVLGGSLVGFSVYLWLLREWGAFRAGLYAFISPIIAVLVGVLVNGESFGPLEVLGMAIMLGATALVLRREPAVSAS